MKLGTSCVLWCAFPALLWSILTRLTHDDFQCRVLLESHYPLSMVAFSAAVTLRPWSLGQEVAQLLQASCCPWGAETMLAAAGRACTDAQPLLWLLGKGWFSDLATVERLITHANRLDLACKVHDQGQGGTLHESHELLVSSSTRASQYDSPAWLCATFMTHGCLRRASSCPYGPCSSR